MKSNPFQGVGIALITPFTDGGEIDYPALGRLVEEQLAGGADFICALGTTAETPTLNPAERRAVRFFLSDIIHGRVPLLLGCGSNSTAEVIDFLQTEDLSGADGLLLVCPYYNKPTQEGLYQHFRAISTASPLPIVLYNIPGRTGVNLEASTTLRLANQCPNIVAVKEASGRIAQIESIISGAPEGFDVLCGDDSLTFTLINLGARGVISVIGNAYPAEFSQMAHALIRGDRDAALRLHRRFGELYRLTMTEGNPAGIKCLLGTQGKIRNHLRLPLVPVSQQTETAIRTFVETFS